MIHIYSIMYKRKTGHQANANLRPDWLWRSYRRLGGRLFGRLTELLLFARGAFSNRKMSMKYLDVVSSWFSVPCLLFCCFIGACAVAVCCWEDDRSKCCGRDGEAVGPPRPLLS